MTSYQFLAITPIMFVLSTNSGAKFERVLRQEDYVLTTHGPGLQQLYDGLLM